MPRCEYDRERRMTIPFTREQERDLKSHNGKEITARQLQLYFNEKYGANKSYECIRAYCVKNNISLTAKRISRARFTQGEIDYINDNSHLTLKELVSNLNDVFGVNRSASGVQRLIKRLGIKKPPTDYHTYTQEHCEYLISYIGPLKDLCECFNAEFNLSLTHEQVLARRGKLLRKHTKKPTITKETRQ